MKESSDFGIGMVFGILICIGFMVIMVNMFSEHTNMYRNGFEEGFFKGQVAALTDSVTVELIEHKDKTVTWEKIGAK